MTLNYWHEDRGSVFYLALVCFVAALGGLLFGYDTAVIADAIGPLQQHFQLSATMKGWAAGCVLIGCMLGVSIAGIFSDRLGRKNALFLSGILFLLSAIGTSLPQRFWVFVFFRTMAGAGVGVASMACPMYIAEITPARIRGRMVSVYQFAIVSGILVTYFVNYFIAGGRSPEWIRDTGWRWMFAAGALPALFYILFLLLVPESPRFLVATGRKEGAREILRRVGGAMSADAELGSIEDAIVAEAKMRESIFQWAVLPVLAIGIALAVLQQITGINVFLYYAPEIFKKLGSGHDVAMLQTVVVGAVNMLFTIIAIWTVDQLGRKPLMIIGSIGMGLSLLVMGIASQRGAISGWMLTFILLYIGCFALSVGPVTWVLLSEIFPTRMRGRALAAATLLLWLADFGVTQTFPMMDESPTLIARFNHGFPFYVYAFFCVVLVFTVWKFVPETKGRSLEEIERFWNERREGFEVVASKQPTQGSASIRG